MSANTLKKATRIMSEAMLICGTLSAQQYQVVDLGTLGGFLSAGSAVNNDGHVVGVSEVASSDFHGFFHDSMSPTNIDPLLGDRQCFATGISDSDDIIAVSYNLGSIDSHAIRISSAGAVQSIGVFTPRGLNNFGSVVGNQNVTLPTGIVVTHACVTQGAILVDLQTLGGSNSRAMDISESGIIVGSSQIAGDFQTHAATWINDQSHDLGTLGGPDSQATAINDQLQAAGYAELASGLPHACIFHLNADGSIGSVSDLGVLPGAQSSYANALNNSAHVVGTSNAHAFLSRGGPLMDLNDLIPADSGWVLQTAHAISDSGYITGFGQRNGAPHAFLLVPESCPGDANGDGMVNITDLNIVLGNFQRTGAPGIPGDLNSDGVVNITDLNQVLGNFQNSCP